MPKGFTLIELLVVVLIIGILSAVALPQYQKAVARARLVQNIIRVQSMTQGNELFHLANGTWSNDVRELDIDFSSDVVAYRKGSWTKNEDNVSAYFKDGADCGPKSPGAACKGETFFIYNTDGNMYCRGYNDLMENICRSMAGNAEAALPATENQRATYLIRF